MEGGGGVGVVEELVVPTADSSVVPLTAHDIPTVDPLNTDAAVVVVDSSLPSDDDSLAEVAFQDSNSAAVSLVDLRAKIVKQVEYYFSDENLPTDKFLMKYVKKNKDGFVPISVIATFRKVKRLTRDSSAIVDALKESALLVVSSDGSRVKRLHPLPLSETNTDQKSSEINDPKFCTVVVENLPEDCSVENIQKIFCEVGNIKNISVHDPQVTGEVNRTKAEKLISGKLHALIEYETGEAAEKAVVTLNDETDWRNGLRVQLLRKRMGLGVKPMTRKGSDSEKGDHDRVPVSVKEGEKNHSNQKQNDEPDNEEGAHVSKEKTGRKGRNRSKGQKHCGNYGIGHATTSVGEPSKPPPGPRMPDGTRGFSMGRGRPLVSGDF